MKHLFICSIVTLLLIFGNGVSFADEDKTKQNPTGTIVGDPLANQYEYVDPNSVKTEPPQVVKKLLDQGVITAVEDMRTGSQPVISSKK